MLIDGLTKHASTLASLTIAGTPYSTTAFIAALQARIAAAKTTLATRATWQSAVKAELDERAKTKTLGFAARLLRALAQRPRP